jgi:hypothetical protein
VIGAADDVTAYLAESLKSNLAMQWSKVRQGM